MNAKLDVEPAHYDVKLTLVVAFFAHFLLSAAKQKKKYEFHSRQIPRVSNLLPVLLFPNLIFFIFFCLLVSRLVLAKCLAWFRANKLHFFCEILIFIVNCNFWSFDAHGCEAKRAVQTREVTHLYVVWKVTLQRRVIGRQQHMRVVRLVGGRAAQACNWHGVEQLPVDFVVGQRVHAFVARVRCEVNGGQSHW